MSVCHSGPVRTLIQEHVQLHSKVTRERVPLQMKDNTGWDNMGERTTGNIVLGPVTRRQGTKYSRMDWTKVELLGTRSALELEIPSFCLCASVELRMRGELPVPTDLSL